MAGMALAALIDDTKARNDWSDRDIVAAAERAGFRVTRSDISNYRLFGMTHIVPKKIIALAEGLRLKPYTVAVAVLQDAGIDIPLEVRTPEEAIAADHRLTPFARDILLDTIRRDRDRA